MRTAVPPLQVAARKPQIVVRALTPRATSGRVELGPVTMRCALGRSGRRQRKREGDGATPTGIWPLREIYYRPDHRRPAVLHHLDLRRLKPSCGWCDDSDDRRYNRQVHHPYPASAERMWRADGLYNLVVVLGYNDRPVIRGRGSAIFLHCARPAYAPTEGCIALSERDLRRLLPLLRPGMTVRIL